MSEPGTEPFAGTDPRPFLRQPPLPVVSTSAPDSVRLEGVERVLYEVTAALSEIDLGRLPWAPARGGYFRSVLHRDRDLEITVIRWPSGTGSPLHGHGESCGGLRVLRGAVVEDAFLPAPPGSGPYLFERSVFSAGATRLLPVGACHRVRAVGEAWSLHVYAPAPDDAAEVIPHQIRRRLASARRRVRTPSGSAPAGVLS